jgi:ectoine hydroxylase-related dioxygenase (phytanoyl-CoA dioxygenase family)
MTTTAPLPKADEARHVLEFDLYGFTVLEGAITETRSAELAAVLARADRDAGTEYTHQEAYARHVKSVFVHDPVFLELIDNPTVLRFVEEALGPDVILGSLNARIVRPGDPVQPLHSDVPPALRKQGKPVMLNAVWMLDAFTSDNGATRVVPGSHRHSDPEPPPAVELPYIVAPTAPAGSVLVFNGQCWHGGGANTSPSVRHALFAHYRVGSWMRFQIDPHEGFPADAWGNMTARQRQLLRMEQGVGQRRASDY